MMELAQRRNGRMMTCHAHMHAHPKPLYCQHFKVAQRNISAEAASTSAAASQPTADSLVEVGSIGGAHGVRGELKVYISTDDPKARFGMPGKKLFLQAPSGSVLPMEVARMGDRGMLEVTTESARPRVDNIWLVKFEEVASRGQAEKMQGCVLLVDSSTRQAPRSRDEFYVTDLISCKVYHKVTGRLIGIITDVFDGTGTHMTLVMQIRQTEQDVLESRVRSCYVPFAKSIVPVVKVAEKRVEVMPPSGLLDLTTSKPMRKPLTPQQREVRIKELRDMAEQEAEELRAAGYPPEEAEDEESDDEEGVAASPRQQDEEEEEEPSQSRGQRSQQRQGRQGKVVAAAPRLKAQGAPQEATRGSVGLEDGESDDAGGSGSQAGWQQQQVAAGVSGAGDGGARVRLPLRAPEARRRTRLALGAKRKAATVQGVDTPAAADGL